VIAFLYKNCEEKFFYRTKLNYPLTFWCCHYIRIDSNVYL